MQTRVDQATAELRQRNRELLDLYQQMFRLREELGPRAATGRGRARPRPRWRTRSARRSTWCPGTSSCCSSSGARVARGTRVCASPKDQLAEGHGHRPRAARPIAPPARARARRPRAGDSTGCARWSSRRSRAPASDARVRRAPVPTGAAAMLPQLELALLNLVSNALDAMPGGGRLAISRVERRERTSRVERHRHAGRACRRAVRDRVFEPWFTTKPPGRGTGLGPEHRPQRRRETWRPDRRRRARPAAARPSPSSCRRSARTAGGGRSMPDLLVVDDDRDTCQFMSELLAAPGRRIVESSRIRRTPCDAPRGERVRRRDLGHQPQRAAVRPRRAPGGPAGEPALPGRAHQRLRHARDGHRGGPRGRVRLHQQAVQHRRRSSSVVERRAGPGRAPDRRRRRRGGPRATCRQASSAGRRPCWRSTSRSPGGRRRRAGARRR